MVAGAKRVDTGLSFRRVGGPVGQSKNLVYGSSVRRLRLYHRSRSRAQFTGASGVDELARGSWPGDLLGRLSVPRIA